MRRFLAGVVVGLVIAFLTVLGTLSSFLYQLASDQDDEAEVHPEHTQEHP